MNTTLYTTMCNLQQKIEDLGASRQLVDYLNNLCGEDKILIDKISDILNNSLRGNLELLEKDINQKILPAIEKVSTSFAQERDALEEAFSLFQDAEKKLNNNVAGSLLEICNRLKNNVELMEKAREIRTAGEERKLSASRRGIGSGQKISIFLTGEFSAGKTTFIKRVLGKIAGATSQFPQTGMMIKHCVGGASSFKINFASEFCAKNEDEKFSFSEFIKNFGIQDKFEQTGNVWKRVQEEIVFSDWGADKCLEFIGRADGFINVVESIQWTRLPSMRPREQDILKYCDMYDLPGIGGRHEHMLTIQKIMDSSSPDIILYLIDTHKGVPSNEGFHFISDLVENILDAEGSKPLFFWVYQMPGADDPDSIPNQGWVEEQKKSIEATLRKEKEEGLLSGRVYAYLNNAGILDARGGSDNYLRARVAVAQAIGLYYQLRLKEYVRLALASLQAIPEMHEILVNKETKRKNQLQLPTEVFTNRFIELVTKIPVGNETMTFEQVKESLLQAIGMSEWSRADQSDIEIEAGIKVWGEKITNTIKTIIKKNADGLNLPRHWPGNKNYSAKAGFTKQRFKQDLAENDSWIEALYLAQAVVLLNAYHENTLPGFFLKDIESKIIESIELDLRKLYEMLETTKLLS